MIIIVPSKKRGNDFSFKNNDLYLNQSKRTQFLALIFEALAQPLSFKTKDK